jgi:hypothetical protein
VKKAFHSKKVRAVEAPLMSYGYVYIMVLSKPKDDGATFKVGFSTCPGVRRFSGGSNARNAIPPVREYLVCPAIQAIACEKLFHTCFNIHFERCAGEYWNGDVEKAKQLFRAMRGVILRIMQLGLGELLKV